MTTVKSVSLAALAVLGLAATGRASLVADFKGSSFNAAAGTLTDGVTGISATTISGTNVAGTNGSVTTTGAGFSFNADAVPGLVGSTSFTTAVAFTYGGGAPGGGFAFNGPTVFGGDIPNFGQGDTTLAVTSDGNNQIVGENGEGNGSGGAGSDSRVYDVGGTPQAPGHNNQFNANTGTFQVNTLTAAVLVADGTADTLTLYANGYLVDTQAWAPQAFGFTTNGAGPYTFDIGSPGLTGTITEGQIYNSALTSAQAIALSGSLGGVPEPTSVALLAVAAAGLLGRRARAVKSV